jgi:hypothetical protein
MLGEDDSDDLRGVAVEADKLWAIHAHQQHTVKKGYRFFRQNSPWPEIIKLFPARKSLVSDIPAEDGKTANLFFTVHGTTAAIDPLPCQSMPPMPPPRVSLPSLKAVVRWSVAMARCHLLLAFLISQPRRLCLPSAAVAFVPPPLPSFRRRCLRSAAVAFVPPPLSVAVAFLPPPLSLFRRRCFRSAAVAFVPPP